MDGFVLTGGFIWDGESDERRPGIVAVSNGQVVGEASEDMRLVDVTGCTVLPGLIEGHGHLCFNARPDWRAVYDGENPVSLALRMALHARQALEAGITTFRDLGAPTTAAIELRTAIQDGTVTGPGLLVSGAPITTTGGHCYYLGGEADGELAVRVAVRQRAKAGVDWIKIMASGGNMTPGSNVFAAQYTVDEMRAAVEEAHRLGLRVAAHCHGEDGIRVALAARADVLEHCSFQTPQGSRKDDALIEEIARAGLVISPTISVAQARQSPDRYAARASLVRQYFAAGCRVIMSTDCGIPGVPHSGLAEGMGVFADMAGLSPVETLRLATGTSADLLGLDDRGRISPGKRADLLVVEGDPLTDLDALTRVRLVVAGGRLLPPQTTQERL